MIQYFFPEAHRESLSVSARKRVPILVTLDFVLIAFFFLSSLLRYRAYPESSFVFFVAVLASSCLFIVSLVLVRLRRYVGASVVSSAGMLLNTFWIAFLLPVEHITDLYRFNVYLIASSVANSLVALRKQQVSFHMIASSILYAFVAVFIYLPFIASGQSSDFTSIITQALLLVSVNLCVLLLSRLNAELLEGAERESLRNRERTTALRELVGNAKDSLNGSRALVEASEESSRTGAAIRRALEELRAQAEQLIEEANSARKANSGVNEYVEGLKLSVDGQGAALEETGSAVTQIMSNIQSMAAIANAKREEMNRVLGGVESQGLELRRVVNSFDKIRDASKSVLAVAASILDISEKTNMLAMNASIEAAQIGRASCRERV